jgi:RNA polymerase sigma-70 factor (ECF subfamily)
VRRSSQQDAGGLAEAEAIRLAQLGDPAAFERLYQLHSRRVYALCLRMLHNPTEAEDLTQDAFLQLFRKIQSFRGESSFSTWLHRLTANIVLMRFRKKNHPQISLDAASEQDEENGRPPIEFGAPDLRLSGLIDRVNLQRAIDQLPPGYKEMFILHDIEGYQHNEIAQIMGCSTGNSKSQLHKARMRLRRLLQETLRKSMHPSAGSASNPLAPRKNGTIASISLRPEPVLLARGSSLLSSVGALADSHPHLFR